MAFRGLFNPVEAREKDFLFPGSTIVVMVRRDPQTGQFRSGDEFDDVEVITFSADFGVTAAENDGSTGFIGDTAMAEGVQLIDYDEIVDRNESLQLLSADHALMTYINSTMTEDGTVRTRVEISASPSITGPGSNSPSPQIYDGSSGSQVQGNASHDDTIDIVGRPLQATGHGPFSDTATGMGGGGSAGEDSVYVSQLPAEMGRFHPRDELFANAEIVAWNVDDAATHVEIVGQHVYGVISD